jgi:phasin family protein
MSANLETFAENSKVAVDSLLSVVNTALASAERIAALNVNASRQFVKDSSDAAKAVLGAKDAQDAVATQANLVQPAVQKAVDYTKALYQITSDAHQELSKLFEGQYAEFQTAATKLVDEAIKNAPAGSETLVAAAKDAIAKANSAFETATALTKNFVETAQSAATVATTKATTAAKKAAK